ncbi:MAG: PHP domain-containing protein [Candidatus Pacebacteria bacterium]|nr:PHP domain-containing protein [Candidatus Paceibacterota bacterium]
MKIIDLHLHSFYSDGELAPRNLLKLAIQNKLSLFSITDHNFISSDLNQIKKEASQQNILFVPGIEISTFEKQAGTALHIVGYSHSFNIKKINEAMTPTIHGYNERAKKIIKKINRQYKTQFNYDEIKREIPSIYVSRNQLVQKLLKFIGGKATFQELLPEVFVEEDNSWMMSPKEAISLIKENDGLAVLAHPSNLINQRFDSLLEKLTNFGLDGIEVYTAKDDVTTIQILEKTALKYHLLATAGSDWHGFHLSAYNPGIKIPNGAYQKILNKFK